MSENSTNSMMDITIYACFLWSDVQWDFGGVTT